MTVVYGLEAKKVHGKIIEVIRREEGTLRSYVCIATGPQRHGWWWLLWVVVVDGVGGGMIGGNGGSDMTQ